MASVIEKPMIRQFINRRTRLPSVLESVTMRRKVKQTCVDENGYQVEAFIKRYRPALEALAKR